MGEKIEWQKSVDPVFYNVRYVFMLNFKTHKIIDIPIFSHPLSFQLSALNLYTCRFPPCLPDETRKLFNRGCLATPLKGGFNRNS